MGCLTIFIGLDVHDKGNRGALEVDMTFTIEPGIYIPEGSNCDEKWWKIAVRIEDDVLVTKDGFELLSDLAPRKSEEIEALMKQPSALDGFVLPDLDEGRQREFISSFGLWIKGGFLKISIYKNIPDSSHL